MFTKVKKIKTKANKFNVTTKDMNTKAKNIIQK